MTLCVGCTPFNLDIKTCPTVTLPQVQDKITVRYLGAGGLLIARGDAKNGQVLLTAPLYSNPSLLEVAGDLTIRPDAELIDRLLPPDARYARAILVGHSHYDHLMDVPYVALHHAKRASIYGSETMAHLLAPISAKLAAQGTALIPFHDDEIWDTTHAGQWKEVVPGVRVAAIRSEHSPQLALKVGRQRIPFHLWRGRIDQDVQKLPRSASEWVEGGVLAYVIDFMDADQVRFRVYYQDSGANEPLGLIPDPLKGDRSVDLAILCLGGAYQRLNDHPGAIIQDTRPRYLLLTHWEDFFVTQDAYCSKGGHYGVAGASGIGCREGEGRIYGLPSAFFVEGSEVKPFLKRVERAARDLTPKPKYWVPCPTRSSFELALR